MRAPRFGKPPERPKRWSRVLIVAAMQRYEREHGRRMVSNDMQGEVPPDMPSMEAIRRHFGTFRAACEAAYGESVAPGNEDRRENKDADTERVLDELAAGRTLKEVAAERGMTGQALGRRLRRYQAAHGLPIVNGKPGAPRRA